MALRRVPKMVTRTDKVDGHLRPVGDFFLDKAAHLVQAVQAATRAGLGYAKTMKDEKQDPRASAVNVFSVSCLFFLFHFIFFFRSLSLSLSLCLCMCTCVLMPCVLYTAPHNQAS